MKKVFQIKLKSLTRVFAMVMAVSLVTFTGCKTYDADIDKLNTDLASLKTDLTALNTSTQNALTVQITQLNTDLTALKARVKTLEDNGATDAEVAAVKADIMSKVVTLEAFNAYKASVTADLAALTTKVNAAATQADLTAFQTTVNAKIVTIEGTLTALGAKVTDLQTNLNNLGSIVDAAKLKIDKNTADIAALKSDVEARLAILEAVLNIQNKKSTVLDGIATQLADQLAKINTNTTDIAKLKSDLLALSAKVDTNTTDITTLRTELAALNTKLQAFADSAKLNLVTLSKRLSSIVFAGNVYGDVISRNYINGIEAINFAPFTTPSCGNIIPPVVIAYHLNPSFIKKEDIDIANMKFAVKKGKNTIINYGYGPAPAASETVNAQFVDIKNGYIYVGVSVADYNILVPAVNRNVSLNGYTAVEEIFSTIALQIPLLEKYATTTTSDGTVIENGTVDPNNRLITSDYIRLNDGARTASEFGIARKLTTPLNPLYPTTLGTDGDYINQATSQLGTAKGLMTQYTVDQDGVTAVLDPLVLSIPYNSNPAATYDLNTIANPLVVLLTNRAVLFNDQLPAASYGTWTYKFDEPKDANGNIIKYFRGGNQTDQQEFIEFTAEGLMKRSVYTQQDNGAAIGRTPIVRIRAYNSLLGECPVYTAYTKLWLEQKPRPAAITVPIDFGSSVATCDEWSGKTTAQWMNEQLYNKVGVSKEAFHGLYDLTYKITTPEGTVNQIVDIMNQDSYVLEWKLTALQIWTKLATIDPANFKIEMIYVPKVPEEYPVINITMTKAFTKPGLSNIATTINKYWYLDKNTSVTHVTPVVDAEFKLVKHNIGVPFVGESVTTNAVYHNNINQAFEQNTVTNPFSLKGLDPYKYEYYFLSPQPALEDGTVLTVSTNGQELSHSGGDLIAKFITYNPAEGNVLELQKTVKAKELLNKGKEFLKARVGIRQKYCPDIAVSLAPITVRGNKNFDVVFIRPINAETVAPKPLVDAKNFGEVGTYLPIREMVQLADWRHKGLDENGNVYSSLFNTTDHAYYWDFYGVTRIWVEDPKKIETNLTGTWRKVADFPNLEVATAPSVLTPGGTISATDGYLTYKNNGNAIGQVFQLKVPVTVEYVWGKIVDLTITVNVEKTTYQPVKRK